MTIVLIIALLIFINFFYVAAEFSAVGVRKGQIHQLADEGNSLAKSLLPFIQDMDKLDRYISACQVGITVSSLVLGAFGQAKLQPILAPLFVSFGNLQEPAAVSASVVVILLLLTFLQIVFGELLPKALAIQFPTQLALYTVLPMRFSLVVFSWLITFLNESGRAFIKILKIPFSSHQHIHSPEEIDLLIAESRDGGVLEPDEQERLHKALQLATRSCRHMMVPRPNIQAIDVKTSSRKALKIITGSPYTRLPVYEETIDNIIGMLHTKDLVYKFISSCSDFTLKEVMRPVLSIPGNIKADQLLATLREKHAHQAVALDEFGGVEGLVTLEDVLGELMGKFGDEFKSTIKEPELLSDGRVRLPGLLHVEDAESWIGILWDSKATTISGHVVGMLGHLPEPGETIDIEGVNIEIESVANNIITSLIATPVKDSED